MPMLMLVPMPCLCLCLACACTGSGIAYTHSFSCVGAPYIHRYQCIPQPLLGVDTVNVPVSVRSVVISNFSIFGYAHTTSSAKK